MNKKQFFSSIFTSIFICTALLITACGKKTQDNSEVVTNTPVPNPVEKIPVPNPVEKIPVPNPVEKIPVPNHSTSGLDLGITKSFSVMAYTSISSLPTSNISGKVGLRPADRSQIKINPNTEVARGSSEVYAGDDVGDRESYIRMAQNDLIAAYTEAFIRTPDIDKLDVYKGNIGGKILPPGVYHWSNGLNIASDFSLDGKNSDVWIFQIDGDLNVAENVNAYLKGNAKSSNIYWQVSGNVTLLSKSLIQGTVMNQNTFEMKKNAKILGRILCKDGKVLLDKNVISTSR